MADPEKQMDRLTQIIKVAASKFDMDLFQKATGFKQFWFDRESLKMNKNLFSILDLFRRTTLQQSNHIRYLNTRKKYKDLCILKKRQFYRSTVVKSRK